MAQKTGALIFDETADRYDIRFDIADYYGGLHCGECMDVFTGGKWKPTRIEYGDNWYLVGIRAEDLNGLRVRIAGDDYPAELVKSKFMKLDGEHIRFVLDCMRENTTKIRNIKQYLKAALFNAPSTIGNYYTSLVAHDMASGALSPKKPQYGDPDYYSCNEGESL